MTRGSLNTLQKSLVLRQCLSGEHTDLYFPRPLMSTPPCRRLWVCNKGETYFPDSDFQSWSPDTTCPGILFGVCRDGNHRFPQSGHSRRVVQHWAQDMKPLCVFHLANNSTCVWALRTILKWLAVIKRSSKIIKLFIIAHLPFILMLCFYLQAGFCVCVFLCLDFGVFCLFFVCFGGVGFCFFCFFSVEQKKLMEPK